MSVRFKCHQPQSLKVHTAYMLTLLGQGYSLVWPTTPQHEPNLSRDMVHRIERKANWFFENENFIYFQFYYLYYFFFLLPTTDFCFWSRMHR